MVVCPCSAGSVAAIAHGMSDNLIERAADVVLKECGQLLLVVRETPFSTLHLENMLKLSHMGVTIMPAAPGFIISHNRLTIGSILWWRAFSIILGSNKHSCRVWAMITARAASNDMASGDFPLLANYKISITIQPTFGDNPFIRMALRSSSAWDPQGLLCSRLNLNQIMLA